jgi:hypothetical protein
MYRVVGYSDRHIGDGRCMSILLRPVTLITGVPGAMPERQDSWAANFQLCASLLNGDFNFAVSSLVAIISAQARLESI